jgi:hypothetical protein
MPGPDGELRDAGGVRTLLCAPDGPKLRNDRDAVDLIGEALQMRASCVAIPVERFEEDFFRLRTGAAGAIVQKFVQYRRRLAIVGDVSPYCTASTAFADFVRETNRGRDIWFVRDVTELETRLAGFEREV